MKIALLVLILTSFCESDTLKLQGFSQFEEIGTTDSNFALRWHRKWNNFLPYKCKANQHSVIEELFDDTWACNGQKGSAYCEGFKMKITATRWDYSNSIRKKVWQLNSTGSSTRIDKDFYVVTQNACCDGENTYYYYAMNNGRFIRRFTREVFDVSISGDHKYFGFINIQYADSADKKAFDYHKVAGIGYLISDSAVISKIAIPNTVGDYSPQIGGNSLTVRLFYRDRNEISIDIKKDSLLLTK